MATQDMLDAALAYARQGVPIFPCQAKRPLTPNGFHNASTDEDQIRNWWKINPGAQIGAPTGTISHLLSVDLDTPQAAQFLEQLEAEHGALPETRHVETSPGRRQIHFRTPDGIPTKSVAGFRGVNGFDIRGDGGYTILPPSVHHKSGQPYRILIDAPLADAPEWLLDLLNTRQPANNNGNRTSGEPIPEGQRNATLTSLAGTMRRAGFTESAIVDALLKENQRCSPPLAQLEVERIARSVARYEPGVSSTPDQNTIETEVIWSCIEGVEMAAIDWLWDQRVPLALTTFIGNPDVGKSLVALDLGARTSTGREFPDGAPNTRGPSRVLLLIAEDAIDNTVKPRLMAAGADLTKIEFVAKVEIRQGARRNEREFALDEDLSHLEAKLQATSGILLVICDTVSSYLGKAEMTKEQSMRRVLLPLRRLCEKYKVAFIGINHLNKRSDIRVIHKSAGAIALVAVPRASWIFGENPETPGDFLMLRHKGNLSKVHSGLSYTIADTPVGRDMNGKDVTAPRIVWRDEPITGTADDLFANEDPKDHKKSKAVKFIAEFLADGPRPTKEVEEGCDKRGIGRRTLWTAVKENDGLVHTYKNGTTWWWSLGPKPRKCAK